MQLSKSRGENLNETWHTFVLERFLVRISKSEHRDQFIFKGGFLRGRDLDLGRETRGLDFLAQKMDSSRPVIEAALKAIVTIELADGLPRDFS
jgi:hypothetical protein